MVWSKESFLDSQQTQFSDFDLFSLIFSVLCDSVVNLLHLAE